MWIQEFIHFCQSFQFIPIPNLLCFWCIPQVSMFSFSCILRNFWFLFHCFSDPLTFSSMLFHSKYWRLFYSCWLLVLFLYGLRRHIHCMISVSGFAEAWFVACHGSWECSPWAGCAASVADGRCPVNACWLQLLKRWFQLWCVYWFFFLDNLSTDDRGVTSTHPLF